MIAHVVATPVLERLRQGASEATMLGLSSAAAYVELDGFVVTIAGPREPLMPNGIALGCSPRAIHWPPPGSRVRLDPSFRATRAWEPLLSAGTEACPARLGLRGRQILESCGIEVTESPTRLASAIGRRS